MKLHIKESILTEQVKKKLVNSILEEFLKNTDIIQHLSSYIPNFDTSLPYDTYKDLPIVMDIKEDIYKTVEDIGKSIEKISKVRKVKTKKSPDMGLSNYIEVFFTKPNNATEKYLQQYKNLYHMNIKISDHFHNNNRSVTHTEDIVGETLLTLKQNILNLVEQQANLINIAEQELTTSN